VSRGHQHVGRGSGDLVAVSTQAPWYGGLSRDVLLPVGTNRYKNAVGLKSRAGLFFLVAQRGLITASTNEKRSAASTMALAKQQLSKSGYSRPTYSQVSVQ